MPIDPPTEDEITRTVHSVFERCQAEKPDRFFTAMVPIIHTALPGHSLPPEMFDREMDELCKFVDGFEFWLRTVRENAQADDNGDIARLGTRLKTMIYCHTMEADYPYLILLNLLRVLNDRDCCFLFLRRDENDEPRTDDDGNLLVYEHPRDKIRLLKKEDRRAETGIAALLERLWYGDYRNAFSHAQYSIENNGMFIGTKTFTGVTGRPIASQTARPVVLPPEQLDALYGGALMFLWRFIEEHRAYIGPFKNGEFHTTELSGQPIRWNAERDQWSWQ